MTYFDDLRVGDAVVVALGVCDCTVTHPYVSIEVVDRINKSTHVARVNNVSYSLLDGAVLSGPHYLDPDYCLLDPSTSLDARYALAHASYMSMVEQSRIDASLVPVAHLLSSEKVCDDLMLEVLKRHN